MKDNGGPAFPSGNQVRVGEYMTGGHTGMTLRDWFAGQALKAWVQAHIDQSVDDLSKSDIARECYSYADAMLKEREK